jgi:hypothetical protein
VYLRGDITEMCVVLGASAVYRQQNGGDHSSDRKSHNTPALLHGPLKQYGNHDLGGGLLTIEPLLFPHMSLDHSRSTVLYLKLGLFCDASPPA